MDVNSVLLAAIAAVQVLALFILGDLRARVSRLEDHLIHDRRGDD